MRLDRASRRRDDLAEKTQRVRGRIEEAERALVDLDAEIRSKGLDPENLDETLRKLSDEYDRTLRKFEADLDAAERDLEPFLKP